MEIQRLLQEIEQEGVKLSIRYDEQNDELIFTFSVQGEEYREVISHSEAERVKDSELLLSYVLAEILSVIRGIKEGI